MPTSPAPPSTSWSRPGRWRAGPVGSAVELDPGDYIRFPADRPHTYEALTPASTAVLVMEYV